MNFITVTVVACIVGTALGCLVRHHWPDWYDVVAFGVALALVIFIGVLRGAVHP